MNIRAVMAVVFLAAGTFFVGRSSVDVGDASIPTADQTFLAEGGSGRWTKEYIRGLMETYGLSAQEVLGAYQIELVTGLEVDPVVLRDARKLPENLIGLVGEHNLKHLVFPEEGK